MGEREREVPGVVLRREDVERGEHDPEIMKSAFARRRAEHAKKRTVVKGADPGREVRGRKAGHTRRVTQARSDFIQALLDSNATRQQVIAALMKPRSADPQRPGGLGLTTKAAENAYKTAIDRRKELFGEVSRDAREMQAMRLLGSISRASQLKQMGPVASLEREFTRVMGTAAREPIAPQSDLRELIGDVLAGMTEEEILAEARKMKAGEKDEDE